MSSAICDDWIRFLGEQYSFLVILMCTALLSSPQVWHWALVLPMWSVSVAAGMGPHKWERGWPGQPYEGDMGTADGSPDGDS